VLVVEKLETLGGSTALSGGALWFPMTSADRRLFVPEREALGREIAGPVAEQ
jgi:hypothetical protein